MANPESAGKSTPWLVIVLLLLLCSAGSAAAVYFLFGGAKLGALGGEASAAAAAPAKAPTPRFVPISPFTVNLQGEPAGQRLLYIGLSLRVGDAATEALLKEHMPEVRSRLLMLMASQKASELITPAGKEALTAQILALFNAPLTSPQPPLAIDGVLFSDFIVQ
ncbi:flagellar basal body-associated protein FliL [Pseudomonas stutzeri]|nr:flagellar basal body-associated protein FliL [Stutzerimonas stutzeri]